MKKRYKFGLIYLLFAVAFLFESCKKTERLVEPELLNSHNSLAFHTDGKLDVLGYGYDVTGGPMKFNNISDAAVIDASRFQIDYPSRVDITATISGDQFYYFGATAIDFSKDITKKRKFTIEATVGDKSSESEKFFTGSATDTMGNQTIVTTSSKYSYATYENIVKIKRIRLTRDANIALLRNYLTPEFLTNIANQDAVTLVKRYGTHVLVDLTLGGRISYNYKAYQINESEFDKKTRGVKAGLFGGLLKIVGITVNADVSKEEINKSTFESREKEYSLSFIGGTNSGRTIVFDKDANTTETYNIAAWEASINDRNCIYR